LTVAFGGVFKGMLVPLLDFAANGLAGGCVGVGFMTTLGLLTFFIKALLLLQDWCVMPVVCGFALLLLGGLGGALLGLLVLPAMFFHFAI